MLAFNFDVEQSLWVNEQFPERRYRQCANYTDHGVCNWMVPVTDEQPWCRACRCNEVIPDLSLPQNLVYWRRLEAAKRYALYTLLQLDLPFGSKLETEPNQRGLLFRFMSDSDSNSEFTQPLAGLGPVYTGHDLGAITINLAEADDVARTRARVRFGEGYRTLLGHFRHELGHYYWNVLIEPQPRLLKEFRMLFGDERADYSAALQRYYAEGAIGPWQDNCLSAYASAHPWEDWAECWAHYMHMIDTLETAGACELALEGKAFEATPGTQKPGAGKKSQNAATEVLLKDWIRLAIAMNALNRSMGMDDAYPFVLTQGIRKKLGWIHQLIVRYKPASAPIGEVLQVDAG